MGGGFNDGGGVGSPVIYSVSNECLFLYRVQSMIEICWSKRGALYEKTLLIFHQKCMKWVVGEII